MHKSLIKEQSKQYIHDLYNLLIKHANKNSKLDDLTDILLKAYMKIDNVSSPEEVVNRLVNYIRIVCFTDINFSKDEELIFIKLEEIGKLAGVNGLYTADFTDKSIFS